MAMRAALMPLLLTVATTALEYGFDLREERTRIDSTASHASTLATALRRDEIEPPSLPRGLTANSLSPPNPSGGVAIDARFDGNVSELVPDFTWTRCHRDFTRFSRRFGKFASLWAGITPILDNNIPPISAVPFSTKWNFQTLLR